MPRKIKAVSEEVREQVDAHLDEIITSNVEDVMEDFDVTDLLTDKQIESLFNSFQKEDWEEVDRILDAIDDSGVLRAIEDTGILSLLDEKAGGLDRNRGNAERLRRYWTRGPGGAKIRWGTSGDWTRCVSQLSKHLGPRAKGYCALRHKEMNGVWPGDKRNKSTSTADIHNNSIYHESKQTSADIGELMLEHKTVGVKGMNVVSENDGIVETIISVTGIVDNVKDRILPGAYSKTLARRKPKGVWSHDWDTPVSKTLDVKELMPGDPELPRRMPNGEPWPSGAGALKVKTQFNLETQRGREAYSDVVFFGDEQEWSIGYNVPVGGAKVDSKSGVREIAMLELYEYSPVLFGAMPLARTTSVKEAQMAYKALKGGAASWLSDAAEMRDEEEEEKEYGADYMEDDDDDELEGKSRELAASQMILVKRAIETLGDLLDAVQHKAENLPEMMEDDEEDEEEVDDDEMGEQKTYDSLEAAVLDIVEDETLAASASEIDKVIVSDDTDALDGAMTKFLDGVEGMMGQDKDDALKVIAEVLADMIDQMNERDGGMPEEEDVEKKRDYSDEDRTKMAKGGMALADGSYPIKDKEDLDNAVQAFGRAKDKEKAKSHIMKRARELEAEDMLPESWMSGKSDYVNLSAMASLLEAIKE